MDDEGIWGKLLEGEQNDYLMTCGTDNLEGAGAN